MLLLSFNFLAATQDISVDSLAVYALLPEELGAGSIPFEVNLIALKPFEKKLVEKYRSLGPCFKDSRRFGVTKNKSKIRNIPYTSENFIQHLQFFHFFLS